MRLYLLLFLFAVAACSSADDQLHQLFDDHWEYSLQANPLSATNQGDLRFNDQLPGTDLDAILEQNEQQQQFLERLRGISRNRLTEENRIHYDIFEIQLRNSIRNVELGGHLLPLNGWWDYYAVFADLPNRVPLQNEDHFRDYIQRLRSFPAYNAGYIERMRMGMERGLVRPQSVFEGPLTAIEMNSASEPGESPWFEPFRELPPSINDKTADELREEAIEAIGEQVIPQYRELLRFLREEYIPAASPTPGITDVPGGEPYYRYLVEMFTTMDITPEEVHQIGLQEVERIRDEMMEIVEETGFGEDFDRFVNFLRTDSQFYAASEEELMKETAWVAKQMDGKLPELFNTLPRLPYGIMKVPDYLAPNTATAYYSRGAADGTRAGFYAVNTYDLSSRPLYEIPALSLHEAVPGHHLQIALQQELEELPRFRTVAGFTAYTEGWALYAERLGLEVGIYDDPYDNFGRLSYEMWRALRLVVDTGLHAKGWSREEAVSFMAENSALALHNIRSEVNRYIFWPGQALAYKMGEIAIRNLRSEAEEELGDRFDLRTFHDVVLLSGSVPLQVLEDRVDAWIREEKSR
ncbi:MAG: DUF885 domain-containing protein [Balneolaceae bacterium]